MKLSLWQQFSSNHSSSYTVIGQFETADTASKAADQLRDILIRIAAWHQEYYERNGEFFGAYHDFPPLAPVEERLAHQYGIASDWNYGVEWAKGEDVGRRVSVFNDFVIVSSRETHYLEQPFSALIEQMGGEPLVDDYYRTQVLVTVTCRASNIATADKLHDIIAAYFKTIHDPLARYAPPWPGVRLWTSEGELHRDGLRLELRDMKLGLPDTLDAIIHYLGDNGCTDITYELFERHKPQE